MARKCPTCDGRKMLFRREQPGVGTQFGQIKLVNCSMCNGTGEINQTNKEYMRTCSDDELVYLLCELVDSGILEEWRIKYHCADSDVDAVRMWLKEKHE